MNKFGRRGDAEHNKVVTKKQNYRVREEVGCTVPPYVKVFFLSTYIKYSIKQ